MVLAEQEHRGDPAVVLQAAVIFVLERGCADDLDLPGRHVLGQMVVQALHRTETLQIHVLFEEAFVLLVLTVEYFGVHPKI